MISAFRLMFWTNWNELAPSIMRSSLSGANVLVIVGNSIRTPNGLAIDHRAEKLYFSDATLDKIERCEYDGSNRFVSAPVSEVFGDLVSHPFQYIHNALVFVCLFVWCVCVQVVLKNAPVHPFGLAVYGEYIFWTDWVRRAVLRADKFGRDMKVLRADIPQQPMGIIAVAKDTNSCAFLRTLMRILIA